MADLKFFFDQVSQPSRAVWIFLEANQIPYQSCLVEIANGEHRTNEDFLKVSANKTVPAIDDNGLKLFESAAIMKYLAAKHNVPDHWYPKDIEKQAKIDEYLSWHSGNLRRGAAGYMFVKYIGVKFFGMEPNPKKLDELYKTLQKSMTMLETHFLSQTQFISSNEISIADIQAVCEFTQFWVADIEILQDNSRLTRWFKDCQKELGPHFEKAHKWVNTARENGTFKL